VIGDDAFVGSDVSLVAPVTVGRGAVTGAGSVVTGDAPADALALGRARQVVKAGWAKGMREKMRKDKRGRHGHVRHHRIHREPGTRAVAARRAEAPRIPR